MIWSKNCVNIIGLSENLKKLRLIIITCRAPGVSDISTLFDYLWHENHISSESISSRFTTLITLTTWTSDDWTGAPWLQQNSFSNFFLDTLYYLTFALETYFLFVSEYRQVVVWAEYYNIVEKTNSPTARTQYMLRMCGLNISQPCAVLLLALLQIIHYMLRLE